MGKQNQIQMPLHEQPCACNQCIVQTDTTQMPALSLRQPQHLPQPYFDYQTYAQHQPFDQAQPGNQVQPQVQFASGSQVNIPPQQQILSGFQFNFQPQINLPPHLHYPPQPSFPPQHQHQLQFPFQPHVQPQPQYQPQNSFPPPSYDQSQLHQPFQTQSQVPIQPPQHQLPNQPQPLTQTPSNPAPTAPSQGRYDTPLDQVQDMYSLVQTAYPVSSRSAKRPKVTSNALDGMNWTRGNAARPATRRTLNSAINAAGMETEIQLPLPRPGTTTNNAAIDVGLPTAMMILPDLDSYLPGISRVEVQDTFSEMFARGQGPRDGFCEGADMAQGDFLQEIGDGRNMKEEEEEDVGWLSE